jgi:hypothetical protein
VSPYGVADGAEIEPLALDDLPAIDASVAAVAVCLVHSDIAAARAGRGRSVARTRLRGRVLARVRAS